jgi:hypothetical protein
MIVTNHTEDRMCINIYVPNNKAAALPQPKLNSFERKNRNLPPVRGNKHS